MAATGTPDLNARIARLEQELKELHARVVALERLVGAGELHEYDRATVRRKVEYDWQG
jgi:cell division protein FtsB